MDLRRFDFSLCLVLVLASPVSAETPSSSERPGYQYVILMPDSGFREEATTQLGHRTLSEIDGGAIIDVYGGANLKRLPPAGFIAELSRAPRIQDITYSAQGQTWFAISGHYVREGSEERGLIYYAKFVFSSDLTRFAAFEISYPVAEKRRMDAGVTQLEKSLRLAR